MKLLSPCADCGRGLGPRISSSSRSPSSRRSSTNSVGGHFDKGRRGGGGRKIRSGRGFPVSSSVPASPTSSSTSRYHQSCCIPNSSSFPSAFPRVGPVGLGSGGGLLSPGSGGTPSESRRSSNSSRSRSRSPFRGANSRAAQIGK